MKDKSLEEKLIELCPTFLQELQEGIVAKNVDENYVLVEFVREKDDNELGYNGIYFWMDELEDVEEYDPCKWNDSRKVKPPENIIFRAKIHEYLNEKEFVSYKCLIYTRNKWMVADSAETYCDTDPVLDDAWVEFKAWDD